MDVEFDPTSQKCESRDSRLELSEGVCRVDRIYYVTLTTR